MKANFPASIQFPFLEQTMEITSAMMAFPVKKMAAAAPALLDMAFEDFAGS